MRKEKIIVDRFSAARARAVGSDADRASWLAARAKGVTATEVKKLAQAADATARKSVMLQLVHEKLNGSAFTGNKYTVWGQLREPVILGQLARENNVEPCGLLIAADSNPRHLATPDGWGVDFTHGDMLVEIKTSMKDVSAGSSAFDRTGYFYQMQWQMHCAGFDRVLYVTEQHDGDFSGWDEHDRSSWLVESGARVAPISREFVERDQAVIDRLVGLADEFLAFFDEARAAEPVADVPKVEALMRQVLEGRRIESEGKQLKEAAWGQLQEIGSVSGDFSHKAGFGSVSFVAPVDEVVQVWDEDRAREVFPKQWQQLARARKRAADLEAAFADLSSECVRDEVKRGRVKLTVTGKKRSEPGEGED